jgi:hypothetical protein
MNPAAIAPLPFGNGPVIIGALILLAVSVYLFFINRKEQSIDEQNAEASVTLDNLIKNAEGNRVASTHLNVLRRIFKQQVAAHPNDELTARLRWIIGENMVTLAPYYLPDEQQAQEVLAPYQEQLAEVQTLINQGELAAAKAAANKPFNWENRDYFTL